MWALAKQTWSRALAASPAPTAPTPALTPTGTSGTASTTTSTESKVPKNLPPGTWNSLVKHYQSIQLDGRDRVLPVTELIGAESILARMHHELTISGQYTPILLGEILQKRSFNAAGEVNPLQKSPKKTTTLAVDEDNQIITAEDPVWSPRSMLAILDGINSIRWAFILVRWGEERHVHTYCDWMLSKGSGLVGNWQWRCGMGLQFHEASETVMQDGNKINEMMLKDILPDKKKAPPVDPPSIAGKGKNSKGQKGKGANI